MVRPRDYPAAMKAPCTADDVGTLRIAPAPCARRGSGRTIAGRAYRAGLAAAVARTGFAPIQASAIPMAMPRSDMSGSLGAWRENRAATRAC